MRTPLAVALLCLCASVASAQSLAFTFSSTPIGPADPGDVIARRTAVRAWQDSVEVYMQQTIQAESGWRIVAAPSGDYQVSVALVPVAKPGYSGMALGVVIQQERTGFVRNTMILVTHYVAVVESAQAAAATLVRTTILAIRNAHP